MLKANPIIFFIRRLFLLDLTPEEQAKYWQILEKEDLLWRLTGPPQKPTVWKIALMWLILLAGLISLVGYWRSH